MPLRLWLEDDVFYMKYLPEEPRLPNFALSGVVPTDPTTWGNDTNYNALPSPVTANAGQGVLVDATVSTTTNRKIVGWVTNFFGQQEPIFDTTDEYTYTVGVGSPQNQVVDVITVSDIDSEHGVEVGYTSTENLVTKMKVTYKLSLAPDNPYPSDAEKHEQQLILRHNMAQYGLHEKSFDWYIYNQPDIVMKCATFWLIRMSTTWRTLKFTTFLDKLNIENARRRVVRRRRAQLRLQRPHHGRGQEGGLQQCREQDRHGVGTADQGRRTFLLPVLLAIALGSECHLAAGG